MNIKDMPHVTVEQVLAMRKAAMKLEADNAALVEENQALRNELEALKSVPKKMAENAAECEHHFLGGYRSKEELDIFVHGMRTVASCMESYANKLEQGE